MRERRRRGGNEREWWNCAVFPSSRKKRLYGMTEACLAPQQQQAVLFQSPGVVVVVVRTCWWWRIVDLFSCRRLRRSRKSRTGSASAAGTTTTKISLSQQWNAEAEEGKKTSVAVQQFSTPETLRMGRWRRPFPARPPPVKVSCYYLIRSKVFQVVNVTTCSQLIYPTAKTPEMLEVKQKQNLSLHTQKKVG